MVCKVSVIIPTYNRAASLLRAINSVLGQSFKDFELIVVDDGSTDDTASIISDFSSIIYLKQENKGVSSARNLGIANANGQYVAFLDSDDEWLPSKLSSQIEYIQLNPKFRWVHTEEVWIRNNIRVNQMIKHKKGQGDQFLPSLNLCLISPSSVLIEKTLLENNLFDESFKVCEDYDLWLRLLIDNPVGFIPEPLIRKYGGHADQLSRKFYGMDLFRVKTLCKLRSLIKEDTTRLSAVETVLNKKVDILKKGSVKHNNTRLLQELESLGF